MEIKAQKKFFSERDALTLLLEETSKTADQMDMTLVKECLYFLYPENKEDDRAYIEKTLPILHEKLGFKRPAKSAHRSRRRLALVAVIVVLGVLMLASVVAYAAFGINVLNFFIYDTKEYWMIHVRTPEVMETVTPDLPAPTTSYDVWGEAVVQGINEMNVSPALPKTIPDGYEYVSTMDAGLEPFYQEKKFLFENADGNCFELIIRAMDQSDVGTGSHIQKEEIDQEIISHNGLEIALAQNFDSVSATWISENCFICISGTYAMADLKAMVDSI